MAFSRRMFRRNRFFFPFVAATALLSASLAAHADTYQYAFTITGLSNGDASFTLDIDEPTIISTTDFGPLPSPLQTTLGYDVVNFGEADGTFLFSQSGGKLFPNASIDFSTTTFEVILPGSSFVGVGSYSSIPDGVVGNAPSSFDGEATLVVMDIPSSSTPEPSSLVLLGTGLLGAFATARRKLRNA